APDSIPDWLVESMEEAEPEAALPPAEPEPEAALPVYQPAPPAARWDDAPASEALDAARQHAGSGEIAAALDTYESLVRASRELDSVVGDLQSLVRQHRSNPAIYR